MESSIVALEFDAGVAATGVVGLQDVTTRQNDGDVALVTRSVQAVPVKVADEEVAFLAVAYVEILYDAHVPVDVAVGLDTAVPNLIAHMVRYLLALGSEHQVWHACAEAAFRDDFRRAGRRVVVRPRGGALRQVIQVLRPPYVRCAPAGERVV